MNYQAFLWDFDGTLFDSYPHIAAALEAALDAAGTPYTHEEATAALVVSFQKALERYGMSGAQYEDFTARHRNPALRPLIEPFPGTAEVLRAICAAGGRNFLYTHRGASSGMYLRAWGLAKYFAGCVDGTMHFPPKPAPDAVRYILSNYGIRAEDAVMIGDREIDVLAGINAGTAGCLFVSHPVARGTAAQYTVADMRSLARALGIELPPPPDALCAQIRAEAAEAARALCAAARLRAGDLVAVGCSSSEMAGEKIGSDSSPILAEAALEGLASVFAPAGIGIAAQCCEHLNRALVVERAFAAGCEIVNAMPMPKAGGGFAYAAFKRFSDPVLVRHVRADAGLDIGGTLIGMHLKEVAVPLRLPVRTVGAAPLAAARVRPPFVGGERALYDADLL